MKFREYVNEASTISSLGATKEQVKAVYNNVKEFKKSVIVDSRAKFIKKSNKKEVTDLMKADGNNGVIVIGFDKSMMYYTIQTKFKSYSSKKDEYVTSQIDQFGNTISKWVETSAIKAISYFKGVKTFNISINGAIVAQAKDDYGYNVSINGENIAYELSKLIEKDMKKLFENAKVQFIKKISGKIEAGDLIGAQTMLNKLLWQKGSSYKPEYVEKTLADFMKDGWDNSSVYQQIKNTLAKKDDVSIREYGWIPYVNALTQRSDPKDIRQAAADVLKSVKEKILAIVEG